MGDRQLGRVGIGTLLVKRPLIMAADGGGWHHTCAEVRSGQVVKKPASIAAHQVERTGEKAAAW